jgi:hypothetical protein
VVGSLPTTPSRTQTRQVQMSKGLFGRLPKRTGWQPVLPGS